MPPVKDGKLLKFSQTMCIFKELQQSDQSGRRFSTLFIIRYTINIYFYIHICSQILLIVRVFLGLVENAIIISVPSNTIDRHETSLAGETRW